MTHLKIVALVFASFLGISLVIVIAGQATPEAAGQKKGPDKGSPLQFFVSVSAAEAKLVEVEWMKANGVSKRARVIHIDERFYNQLERLPKGAKAEIDLDLFENVKLVGVVHRVASSSPETKAWGGAIKGQPDGMVSISHRNSVTTANIRSPEQGLFQIRAVQEGKYHVISETDEDKVPPSGATEEREPQSSKKKVKD